MNPEQWQQVKQILDRCLQLEEQQRSSYLDQVFAADPELRPEVESLLRSHEQAQSRFLRDPAIAVLPDFAEVAPVPRIGRRIGAYDVLEEIGRGGMGEVYRAVRADGEFDREVAVKMVRVGFDTRAIVERFRNERQILAELDHPNIARLLDGGTTEDGIPYLVMELVDGMPIDQHCNARALPVTRRLELFRQVCGAVQYAHQHLVIHRDLKPGNILVTPDGIPKLLDFGIAKIVSPTAGSEATLLNPLTPEYASPEQVRSEPVSTTSDVYSLGVVLYQLLTGRSPYPGSNTTAHQLARAICDSEPLRPSVVVLKPDTALASSPESAAKIREDSPAKLHRRLSGDLDNILLKAIRKEPQRRYQSVEQFSEDIRRHLQGLPVTARQDSWPYRTGKFIRRHTVVVAATFLVIATLAIGMAMTLREKRIAERRFNDVRKLANSLIFEIDKSIGDLPGSTPARKLLVERALEYLDSLSRESKGDASLQAELATAYEKVGDVLGYPYGANLGDFAGALQSYRKATPIRESLAAANPNDVRLQTALAANYFRIANVLEGTGDLSGALGTMKKALAVSEAIAAHGDNAEAADHVGGSYYFIGLVLDKSGDIAGAIESYHRALSTHEAALKSHPDNPSLQTHVVGDYGGLAYELRKSGDIPQAIELQTQAVEKLRGMCRASPNSAMLREYLGEGIIRLGEFRAAANKPAWALEAHQEARQVFGDLVAADPKNTLAKGNFGFSDNSIAEDLISLGRPATAIPILQEALRTFQELSPATTGNRYVRSGLSACYSGFGSAYSTMAAAPHVSSDERGQKWREARAWYEKSLAGWLDKEKRGELESDEQAESQTASQNIARCDAALKAPNPQKQARAQNPKP
jgi:tetratricopeptide (TPR) repeat protein